MVTLFSPSRPDGRSDARVIYDLATGAAPETHFDFPTLIRALSEGLPTEVDRQRVYKAIAAGNRLLLRQDRRMLQAVRGRGYRVPRANEHALAAIGKKTQAEKKLRTGEMIVTYLHDEELTPVERALARGQAFILGALRSAFTYTEKRLRQHDAVLDEFRVRLERLEGEAEGESAGQG